MLSAIRRIQLLNSKLNPQNATLSEMNILDKYIIKKFLAAFFFSVMILVTVICVIDFTEKNDDFIQRSEERRVGKEC